jgi:hypothetical protein
MAGRLVFDAIGGWVAGSIVLFHTVAFAQAKSSQRRMHVVLHAAACLGMTFSRGTLDFLLFAALAAVALLLLFDDRRERLRLGIDLGFSLVVMTAAALVADSVRGAAISGLLLGLASRLGLWPFGGWLRLPRRMGRALQMGLVLSGGTAWLAFLRHARADALDGLADAQLFGAFFAISAMIAALSASRNPLPIADFARAHIAVATAGGVLFFGSGLVFNYGFATLVASTAVCALIAGNYEGHAYRLSDSERNLLAVLVVICVGCPLTALFVEEELTLAAISFTHPIVAFAIAVVYVVAAVALMRFYFEQTATRDLRYLGRRAPAGWCRRSSAPPSSSGACCRAPSTPPQPHHDR